MDEKTLIAKLGNGDNEAFVQLINSYGRTVMNICYRFLLNREDAEDVSQDVFIEIFRSVSSFKGESKLSTWICRIAIAKSLDEIKKKNRKKRLYTIGKVLGLDKIINLSDKNDTPVKAMEKAEDFRILLEFLNKIPESQRIAFTLSKIEGYNNPEIADVMQITITAVESLIYRAKKNLQELLNNNAGI